MEKGVAEKAVRRAIGEWVKKTGVRSAPGKPADFYAFKRWAEQSGYAVYLNHPDRKVELWFDQELQQMDWR